MPDAPRVLWRRELGYLLELLALTGIAIAQPVLDVFGRSPETFILAGAEAGTLVAFCAVVCLVPPLVLLAGGAITNVLGRTARLWVQTVILAGLFGLFVLQVVKKGFGIEGTTLVLVSVLFAVGFALLYRRTATTRLWVRYLSPAPLLFTVLFLAASPASALLVAPVTGTAHVSVGAPHTVIMLTLDEFPLNSIMRSDGTIDSQLFPGFARLAAGSTWYRNATAGALRTFYAVPAILTGRYPNGARLPVAREYPHNIFSLLGGSYDVTADETITRLCTKDVCQQHAGGAESTTSQLVDDASSTYETMIEATEPHDEVSESVEEATDTIMAGNGTSSQRVARFERFLASLTPSRRPALHFLHILLPHGPSQYYASGVRYTNGDAPIGRGGGHGDTWTTDAGLVSLARQRHLLQVQYVDHLVSRMIDRLQEEGMWDDAVVVVSPDHGIAFEPGQSSRNGDADRVTPATPEIVWIPMFIKAPGQHAGVISDADVRTIDILPTIADLLDVKIPWAVDGISAVGHHPRPEQEKRFYGSWSDHGIEEPGGPHTIDDAVGTAYVRAHGVDHFRDPGDPRWALYRVGPHPDLVGRAVADLPVAAGSAGQATLAEPDRFHTVALSQGIAPGIVYGTTSGVENAPIAVAVNGVIGAVVPRLTDGDGADFAAFPPDWLWHDGANAVAVYSIESDGTLRRLTTSP